MRKARMRGPLLASASVALLFALAASAAAAEICDRNYPVLGPVQLKPSYIDKRGSVPDEENRAENDVALAPLRRMLNDLSDAADQYENEGDERIRACAMAVLREWAEAGALTPTNFSSRGEPARSFALSTLAVAYLKLGGRTRPDPVVETWLAQLADAGIAYAGDRRARWKANDRNIDYWIGFGVGMIGWILDRKDYLDFAFRIYREGIGTLTADGMLPREVARGSLALRYHSLAAGPLLGIARLGSAEGIDLYEENDSGVCRLVRQYRASASDPGALAKAAGADQAPMRRDVYWMALAKPCVGVKVSARPDAYESVRFAGEVADLDRLLPGQPPAAAN